MIFDPVVVVVLLSLYGVIMFVLGMQFARATLTTKRPAKPPDEQQTVLVKRTRTSFRNPGKTTKTAYDEYKTSKGLYAPVRPGRGSTADEIDPRE